MFSSLESQGLRSHHLWGMWSIHPDGTNWGPLFSAFEIGNGTADSTHFQTQLSDGSIVVESYYNLNNFGFGTYFKFPAQAAGRLRRRSAPATSATRATRRCATAGTTTAGRIYIRFPFSPYGIEALTPFVLKGDWPSRAGRSSARRTRRASASSRTPPAPRTTTC